MSIESETLNVVTSAKYNQLYLLEGGKKPEFCHKKWRHLLLETEKKFKELHPDYSLCGPFGLELLSNADLAPKRIKKFYLYINNPENKSIALIAQLTEKYIFEKIEMYYPDILNDFVIKIHNQYVHCLHPQGYEFRETDKLLDIQVRDTQNSIIKDYGDYVILSHQTILEKIGEASNYETCALYRSRMFQLSLMLFNLYKSFLPEQIVTKLSPFVWKLKPFINNSLNVFIAGISHKLSIITDTEQSLIKIYIIPLCNAIDKLLSDSIKQGNFLHLNIKPYHIESNKKLEANINIELYDSLLNTIVGTYKNFC